MKKIIFSILFACISLCVWADTRDAKAIYKEANLAYQKMDYANSALLYEKLLTDGHPSPEVYYNLGNSYFKGGNIPKAILNYERGKKLSPEDEDIDFNLKIAALKVVDRIDAVPEVFYKRWIHSISSLLPANTWSIIFISVIWLAFLSAGYYVIGQTVSHKRTGFILILIFAGLSIVTYFFSSTSYSKDMKEEQAIVMSSSVYVKSSPDEKGNDLFILHEGTKVDVLEPFEDWAKIRIANGTIGWLKVKDVEKI